MTAAAGTKKKAIEAEGEQATDAGLGGTARTDADGQTTADDTSDDVYGLSISRDRAGTTIKITDPDNAGDDDPKFSKAMDLGSTGQMHTRTMEADDDGNVMTEVAVVYTDIAAPKAVAFAKFQNAEGTATQTLNIDLDPAMDADNDGTADNDLTARSVGADGTTAPTADEIKLVMSGGLGSGGSTQRNFAGYQLDSDTGTAGNQTIQAYETAGTYNGAMGTYRCNGGATGCTISYNTKGEISAMSAGWVFIPGAGATSDQPDYDYLHYGFWLKRTADADGVLEYNEVETFAGSSIAASDGSQLDTVTGSASYEGSAAGVYVHSVVNPDGTEASATSGHFTANASLMAYFGQTVDDTNTANTDESGRVAPNMLNTVTGTIDSFVLSGGEAQNWAVALQGSRAAGANTFSGTAKGGVGNGSFSGTYHGSTPETDSDGDGTTRVAPGSMVGEFNAGFTNGSVAGAFGARKK
ncbi:MAG: hypothetical protein OYH76_22045 [Defluviicoccus sp.]|nr:hypothetical protein [Defluviicoccus sp.]MDE0278587.1 hypothetical protein [Defluviicoccus sp.]